MKRGVRSLTVAPRMVTLGVICLAVLVAPARAQFLRPIILQDIGIDQKLNGQIPLDAIFHDETGKQVRLRDYFGRKPVLLSLVYFDCPMLCPMTLDGLLKTLEGMSLNAGRDFNVLTVSFNPRETPAQAAPRREMYLERYHRAGAENGWHFLTGDDPAIQALTTAVGFRYVYDPASKQYAHANGIMILTPEGKIARYFYGLEFPPRDVRLGLVEASANKIGTRADQVLLYCLHYDPQTGRYGVVITRVIRAAGISTVLAIGLLMLVLSRRERGSHPRRDR